MNGRGFLLLLLGLVLGVLVVQVPRWMNAAQRGEDLPVSRLSRVGADCDPVATVCTARLGELRVALQIKGPVQGLRPFRVQVVAAGMRVTAVHMTFTMQGMDMGQNRYRLLPEGNGWVGLVTLPVCATGRSDWQVAVRLRGSAEEWEAVFPLVMTAPGR